MLNPLIRVFRHSRFSAQARRSCLIPQQIPAFLRLMHTYRLKPQLSQHMKKALLSLCLLASALSAHAYTQYIASATNFNYSATQIVAMAGGQTVTRHDTTHYVTSGILFGSQNLYYGPGRIIAMKTGANATFDGANYLTGGTLFGSQNVYYSSSQIVAIQSDTTATFGGGGYLTGGTLLSSQNLYYGPGRIAAFKTNTYSTFDGANYVSSGYMFGTQNLTTSSGTAVAWADSFAAFSGGYYTP
jgi:hypothetical protein